MSSRAERVPSRLSNAVRTRRLAKKISIDLASHTVQVTTEAMTRMINTAFTTGSALRYMPQGLRSRGSVAVATTLSCANADRGATSQAISATPPRVTRLDLQRLRGFRIGEPRLFQCFISISLIHETQ